MDGVVVGGGEGSGGEEVGDGEGRRGDGEGRGRGGEVGGGIFLFLAVCPVGSIEVVSVDNDDNHEGSTLFLPILTDLIQEYNTLIL